MSQGHLRQPEFGRRLRALREKRGLSQRDLAGGMVNPSYISLLESGSRLPTLRVVVRLSAGEDGGPRVRDPHDPPTGNCSPRCSVPPPSPATPSRSASPTRP